MVDTGTGLGNSVCGVIYHGSIRPVRFGLANSEACLVAPYFVATGCAGLRPAKAPTSQQTNQRIQELAGLAAARVADTPIGSGDLIHVEVFDVPELSRDLRVSETGDITYPLIPGKIPASGLTADQLEQKLAKLLIENGLVSHPQVSRLRKRTEQPAGFFGRRRRKADGLPSYPAHHLTGIAGTGRRRHG